MTPIEELKATLRETLRQAAVSGNEYIASRCTESLAAIESLEADLESTRRALEQEVARVAELEQDRERLDWIGLNCDVLSRFPTDAGIFWAASKRGKYARCENYRRTAREAIDAARKEGA